jgi:hypothetical protein
MGIVKAASVSHLQETQTLDYHGFNTEVFKRQTTTLQILSGPMLPVPYKWKDNQAAAGLQLVLAAEKTLKEGVEQRVIVDENDQSLVRVQEQDLGKTNAENGYFVVGPWFEVPLPQNVWMVLGGEFFFFYPDFERGNRFGSRKAYLALSGPMPPLNLSGEMSYSEVLNVDTEATTIILDGQGTASYANDSGMNFSFTLQHKMFDYLFPNLNGPDTSTSGTIEVSQSMPLNFSLSASGIAEQQSNFIKHDVPSFGAVSADGQVLSGRLALAAAPFAWFSATIEQLFQQNTWDIENRAAQDQFELSVPETLDVLTITGSINLTF